MCADVPELKFISCTRTAQWCLFSTCFCVHVSKSGERSRKMSAKPANTKAKTEEAWRAKQHNFICSV